MEHAPTPPNMTTKIAAAYLGVSQSWLRILRMSGEGPKYCRIGQRTIRYRQSDLDEYADAGEVTDTAEAA